MITFSLIKRVLAVAVCLLAAVCSLRGDTRDERDTLLRLELNWANAVERNDVPAIARYLHPDFTFTSPTGDLANREDHLRDFRTGAARFPLVALSDVEVRLFGTIAVVTSRPTIDGTVKVNGRTIILKCQAARWTDTLVRQDGVWTCVARQQSNIAPAATKVTPVLEQLLREKVDGRQSKLTVLELEYAPGAGTPPHSHPGPVAVYVLDGAIQSQVDDGPLTTYRHGESFFEPAHGKHRVSRNASPDVSARFLAYFLTHPDEPLTTPASDKATAAPEYDEKGNLKLPRGFESWVFVGANLGLRYPTNMPETTPREKDRGRGANVGEFHNVYINPESYTAYLKTGKFPDRTVLVMDVYEAKNKEPQSIVIGGHFPGKRTSIEVAVKNSNRPDGSKTDWAYYAFQLPDAAPVPAFPDSSCYDCHRKHASDDNVWVQFYPILQRTRKSGR